MYQVVFFDKYLADRYMKKILMSLFLVVSSIFSYAQTKSDTLEQKRLQLDTMKVQLLTRVSQHTAQCYKLYPTDNIWTFLELETFSGRIWQVQYSTEGASKRFKTVLNGESLLPIFDTEEYAGRFELYKTQNMYNFILLDTSNGNTWQVQWSHNENERMVLRIW